MNPEIKGEKAGSSPLTRRRLVRPGVGVAVGGSVVAVDEGAKAHVRQTVDDLESEPLLAHLVEEGKLKIVGAEYQLHTGKVTVL